MRLRILTKYITKELIGPFFFGMCAFGGILMGVRFMSFLRLAERHGIPFSNVLKLLALDAPGELVLGIPMAMLLATILALSRLSSNSETVAMRAGGLSFFRLTLPVMVVGLIMSGVSFFISESVVPKAMTLLAIEKDRAVGKKFDANIYNYNYAEYDGEQLSRMVQAGSFNPGTGRMSDVVIIEFENKKVTRLISAETLVWLDEGWYFKNGEVKLFREDTVIPVRFANGYYPNIKASPKEMVALAKDPEEMSYWELAAYIEKTKPKPEQKRQLEVDLYTKLALPFACFFLSLLAAPVALQSQRRSSSAGFGLSFLFIVIYYFLMGFGSMLGKKGVIPPLLGAWLQNIVLGGFGIYQFIRAKK